MSEEFRREAELNEAELEGVSGGDKYLGAIYDAKNVCGNCPLGLSKVCTQKSYLAQYILSLYPNKIRKYTECPYYK